MCMVPRRPLSTSLTVLPWTICKLNNYQIRRVPWTSDLGGPIYRLIGNLQRYTSINRLEQAVENSFTRDCTCPSSLHVSSLSTAIRAAFDSLSSVMLALSQVFSKLKKSVLRMPTRQESQDTFSGGCRLHRMQFDNTVFGIGRINLLFQVAADSIPQNPL